MENKKRVRICNGKMCSLGFCTDCNHFDRYSENEGYCQVTGRHHSYNDWCEIDKWTGIR